MNDIQQLLKHYIVDVQFPEVSGFEILELLDVRSKLAERERELTDEQRAQLEEADKVFMRNAAKLYRSLAEIGDLKRLRQKVNIPRSHWWWYLDKLVKRQITVWDIMTKRVVTVSPSTSVKELSELLAKKRISGVPVVDEQKRVVGIATEADILANPGAKTVEEIMTKRVISVTPDTPVEEIAKLLVKKKIKRVPVIAEGKLVGIVSRVDILKARYGG